MNNVAFLHVLSFAFSIILSAHADEERLEKFLKDVYKFEKNINKIESKMDQQGKYGNSDNYESEESYNKPRSPEQNTETSRQHSATLYETEPKENWKNVGGYNLFYNRVFPHQDKGIHLKKRSHLRRKMHKQRNRCGYKNRELELGEEPDDSSSEQQEKIAERNQHFTEEDTPEFNARHFGLHKQKKKIKKHHKKKRHHTRNSNLLNQYDDEDIIRQRRAVAKRPGVMFEDEEEDVSDRDIDEERSRENEHQEGDPTKFDKENSESSSLTVDMLKNLESRDRAQNSFFKKEHIERRSLMDNRKSHFIKTENSNLVVRLPKRKQKKKGFSRNDEDGSLLTDYNSDDSIIENQPEVLCTEYPSFSVHNTNRKFNKETYLTPERTLGTSGEISNRGHDVSRILVSSALNEKQFNRLPHDSKYFSKLVTDLILQKRSSINSKIPNAEVAQHSPIKLPKIGSHVSTDDVYVNLHASQNFGKTTLAVEDNRPIKTNEHTVRIRRSDRIANKVLLKAKLRKDPLRLSSKSLEILNHKLGIDRISKLPISTYSATWPIKTSNLKRQDSDSHVGSTVIKNWNGNVQPRDTTKIHMFNNKKTYKLVNDSANLNPNFQSTSSPSQPLQEKTNVLTSPTTATNSPIKNAAKDKCFNEVLFKSKLRRNPNRLSAESMEKLNQQLGVDSSLSKQLVMTSMNLNGASYSPARNLKFKRQHLEDEDEENDDNIEIPKKINTAIKETSTNQKTHYSESLETTNGVDANADIDISPHIRAKRSDKDAYVSTTNVRLIIKNKSRSKFNNSSHNPAKSYSSKGKRSTSFKNSTTTSLKTSRRHVPFYNISDASQNNTLKNTNFTGYKLHAKLEPINTHAVSNDKEKNTNSTAERNSFILDNQKEKGNVIKYKLTTPNNWINRKLLSSETSSEDVNREGAFHGKIIMNAIKQYTNHDKHTSKNKEKKREGSTNIDKSNGKVAKGIHNVESDNNIKDELTSLKMDNVRELSNSEKQKYIKESSGPNVKDETIRTQNNNDTSNMEKVMSDLIQSMKRNGNSQLRNPLILTNITGMSSRNDKAESISSVRNPFDIAMSMLTGNISKTKLNSGNLTLNNIDLHPTLDLKSQEKRDTQEELNNEKFTSNSNSKVIKVMENLESSSIIPMLHKVEQIQNNDNMNIQKKSIRDDITVSINTPLHNNISNNENNNVLLASMGNLGFNKQNSFMKYYDKEEGNIIQKEAGNIIQKEAGNFISSIFNSSKKEILPIETKDTEPLHSQQEDRQKSLTSHKRSSDVYPSLPHTPGTEIDKSSRETIGTGSLKTETRLDKALKTTPKEYSDASQMGPTITGNLAIEIVNDIFRKVNTSISTKRHIGEALSKQATVNSQTLSNDMYKLEEDDFRTRSEKALVQISKITETLIAEEVKKRSCNTLQPQLQEFLAWLLEIEEDYGHQEMYKEKDNFLFSQAKYKGKEENSERYKCRQCARNKCESPHCSKCKCCKDYPRHNNSNKKDINRGIDQLNTLIREYHHMSEEEKLEVRPVYAKLTEQLDKLHAMSNPLKDLPPGEYSESDKKYIPMPESNNDENSPDEYSSIGKQDDLFHERFLAYSPTTEQNSGLIENQIVRMPMYTNDSESKMIEEELSKLGLNPDDQSPSYLYNPTSEPTEEYQQLVRKAEEFRRKRRKRNSKEIYDFSFFE